MARIVNLLSLVKLNYQNRSSSFTIANCKYMLEMLILLEREGYISHFFKKKPNKYTVYLRDMHLLPPYYIEICYRHHKNYLNPTRVPRKTIYRGQRWLVLEGGHLKFLWPNQYRLGDVVAKFN